MSIRSFSRTKRSSRSFLNQPIQYREVIRKRNGHQTVGPLEYGSNTPQSRIRQSSQTESRLQNLLGKSPQIQTPLQKSKQIVFLFQQKQRKAISKNDQNYLSPLKRTLTTSIKSFKDSGLVDKEKMNTLSAEKGSKKRQQPLQPQQSNLQLRRSQAKFNQNATYSLEELNEKLENLVTRKLKLVVKQTNKNNGISSSIVNIMKENINQELVNLVEVIKDMKSNTKGTQLQLLNQKIYFIETLLAEQSTQSQLMKKYYYKVASNNKKGKVGDFSHFQLSLNDICNQMASQQKQKRKQNAQEKVQKHTKPLFSATINQQAYKKPNLSDYQSFRYKQNKFAPNLQPLPRSSYKREFLYLKSQPNQKIINRDHSPYYPHHKTPFTSVYDKDYKTLKTEIQDHRELDAYKNKFKILKVNYMPKSKFESVNLDRSSYIKDLQSSSRANSPEVLRHRASENEMKCNKNAFKSQAHRSFIAEQLFEKSRIKHQQLKQFQYRMKALFKA